MAAIGRILQIIGWLWVLVGFIGPRVDLDAFGLESIGVLPGLVLVFIARAFRARARAEEEEEGPGGARPDARPRSVETRPERRQTPPAPAPARTTPSPPAERKPQPAPKVEPQPAETADLLERIVLTGRSAADELSAADLEDELKSMRRDDERKPMSSAEMIAQARRRWDRPGR
jgi:hypothetical protein